MASLLRASFVGVGSLSLALITSGCGDDRGRTGDDELGIEGGLTLDEGTSTASTGGEQVDDDESGVKFDMDITDAMGNGGDCPGGTGMPGDVEFSFIWVANSPQGTVSKIDTKTGLEVARYVAGPGVPDPSRTSVNLYGDVVVADRNGGLAKIAVEEEGCEDFNGVPGIQTSQGPGDVLAWGADECVVWQLPLAASGQFGPRPVAWEGGDQNGCALPNPRVWIGYRDAANGYFKRLDGSSGAILDEVTIPWAQYTAAWGPYGGATNKDGDFWVVGHSVGPLVRIDSDNLVPEIIEIPVPPSGSKFTYGMALDADGRPWVAGGDYVYNYDPATAQWTFINVPSGSMRGLMVDKEGRAWVANNGASFLVEIDTVSKTLINPAVPLAGALTPVGISIDVDGKVWVVDQGASMAFKVDPDTYQTLLTVSGLVSPYTYSDMTGAGLGLVTFPPTE
ncbi:hypothetical protein ACNOYE_06475 [Nannocystaceae bacterium ST9]